MAVLATLVDFVHALSMAAWVLGLPLLFWHRLRRLSQGYAIYAVGFVVLNVLSSWLIGECFLTTIARYLWDHAPDRPANTDEWFTVRFSELVFGLTPSHAAVKLISKALVAASALGALHTGVANRLRRRVPAARNGPRKGSRACARP